MQKFSALSPEQEKYFEGWDERLKSRFLRKYGPPNAEDILRQKVRGVWASVAGKQFPGGMAGTQAHLKEVNDAFQAAFPGVFSISEIQKALFSDKLKTGMDAYEWLGDLAVKRTMAKLVSALEWILKTFKFARGQQECPEFYSQLSQGMKGMLLDNGNWVTWQIDKSGAPHHDGVAEECFLGYYPSIVATHWWDGRLSVTALSYRGWSEEVQGVVSSYYGNRGEGSKIFLETESGLWEGSFRDYGIYVRQAEDAMEEASAVSAGWVRKNCKFAATMPPSFSLTPTEKAIFDFLLEANQKLNLMTTFRVAGGWVRDKLLGKESDDIDIALDRMKGEELAERLKALQGHPALGKVYIVKENPEQSKHIGTAAVELYGQKIDFVNLREEQYDPGSRIPKIVMATGPDAAEKDSKRRDLTFNALFYNVNAGQIEDYVGGVEDLKTMTLDTPDDPRKTLLEDPLRGLRWLRFYSKYQNAKMAPRLVKAMADPAVQESYRTKVKPSRAFPELKKLMEGARPGAALRFLFETSLYKSVFHTPSFAGLGDIRMDQKNKHHALNLLDHTLAVMDELNKVMKEENVDPETRMLMNFAALFHDVGKLHPEHQKPHEKRPGEMMYPGHEEKSAEITDELLRHVGMGRKARKLITQVIKHHKGVDWIDRTPPEGEVGAPGIHDPREKSRYYVHFHEMLDALKPIEKGIKTGDDEDIDESLPSRPYDVGEIAKLVWLHRIADRRAHGFTTNEDQAAMARVHMENMARYYPYWASLKPIVRGDEIISMFPNLPVGRRVKGESFVSDLVKRLKEQQATGKIKTRDEALKFLESMRDHIQRTYGNPTT